MRQRAEHGRRGAVSLVEDTNGAAQEEKLVVLYFLFAQHKLMGAVQLVQPLKHPE